MNGYPVYVLQLFVYLVLMRVLEVAVINKIDFKKYVHYLLTELSAYYMIMLIFAYFGKWFSFNAGNLFWSTVIFWAIGGYMHYHFYAIRKTDAEEINDLLREV